MKQFIRVLINISVANTSTYLLWSAFSFWIYLETRSVLVLSVLSGTYMLLVTLSSMFFGTIVDKHKKKRVIAGASVVTMALLLMAGAIFFLSDTAHLADMSGKEAFGWLLGEGDTRGIALTFVITGTFMFLLSLLAFRTKAYHILSTSYKRNMVKEE